MILYHTSDREIRHPEIHRGRKNADFGWGFYLTPDREFACRWAQADAVINEYELEESGLVILHLQRDAEWFEAIFNNRRLRDGLTADVVIGPIANDTIFETMGIISSGFLAPDDALKLLRIGPEYTQVAIKTEIAAAQLTWRGAERISRMEAEQKKAEENAYQELFAKVLTEIVGE